MHTKIIKLNNNGDNKNIILTLQIMQITSKYYKL